MVNLIGAGESPTPAQLEYFETHIRPVLVEHCYACHAADAKNIRGGLLLDTRGGLLKGGDSGAAIVAGKPDESLLMEALRYESLEMPPDGKLSAATIAEFATWIAEGAADPRDGTAKIQQRVIDLNAGRQFWAFRPVEKPHPPRCEDDRWPRSAVDQFLLARFEADGLRPAGDAEPAMLLRRAKFDLTGLPPTSEEIQSFASQPSQAAFQRIVDSWLHSPQFGERWGRHWLDVARFAESSGGGRSLMFPDAWRYRDYVIDAFNADVPFARFIREQIAGDLLEYADQAARDRQLVATGFLALGPTNYELQDKELLELEVVDEQIDTIGRAFLGLTLGCARCHDHKFDPLPMTDYYALAGIFASTETVEHSNVSKYVEQTLKSDPEWPRYERAQEQLGELRAELKAAQQRAQELKAERAKLATPGIIVDDDQAELVGKWQPSTVPLDTEQKKDAETRHEYNWLRTEIEEAAQHVTALQQQIKEVQSESPRAPLAMSVRDRADPQDTHLLIRGEIRKPGPLVRRGFLSVACPAEAPDGTPAPARIAPGSSGRRELAEWLASADNPLTARVMANRVWHYLFGAGLVRTTDNLGVMGDLPAHPELLDYLAADFVESGWSVKHLVRQIMLSHVYQLDSRAEDALLKVDPENRLFARANRRRLDAEAIRDAMLSISGQLETAAGGLTINKITQYDVDYTFDSRLRSVYVPRFRNAVLDLFQTFDVANPNVVTGRRNTSVLPTQALYFMNSQFVAEQAEYAAKRLIASVADKGTRLEHAFLMTLGRQPTVDERRLIEPLVEAGGQNEGDEVARWSEVFHLLFGSIDFRYLY